MLYDLRGADLQKTLKILGSNTVAGAHLRAQDSYYVAFASAQTTVQAREVLLWYSNYAVVAGTVADAYTSVGPANPDGDCLICVPFMDISMLLTSIEHRNLVK
jgi:hypothetical protein